MSNQIKFLVSILFIAVIVLCVVLTRVYFDVTKNTENSIRDSKISSVVKNYGDMQVFKSVNGYYGLMDGDASVLIEPEWTAVLDVTDTMALVRMGKTELIGGVDYEENVVLPFVFCSMLTLDNGFHVGIVEDDGRKLLYDKNYQLVFQESFQEIRCDNSVLSVTADDCILFYHIEADTLTLQSAELQCKIDGDFILNWKIANQVYLAELDAEDLRTINHHTSAYMQMLFTQDFSGLEAISGSDYVKTLQENQLPDGELEEIIQFSFSKRESGAYDFSFTLIQKSEEIPETTETIQETENLQHLEEQQPAETESISQQTEVHLYFRRNTENQMILTAAELKT